MPFAVAGLIGTGVSAGMSSSSAAAAQKAQQQAAMMRMQMAEQAKNQYYKEQAPYSQFGYGQLPLYEQAIGNYEAALPGYGQKLNAYDQAQQDYTNQGIGGVNSAMGQYQGSLDRFGQAQGQYQGALGQYGQAMDKYGQAMDRYNAAIPEMTQAYGMDQYKQSPLYTPMVNNLAELQATPGYQFQLQQGQQQLGQSAAARGGLLSGAQLKASQNYAQNQASTGFQNAWQRSQDAYGKAFGQNLQTQQQMGDVLMGGANLAGTNVGYYGNNVGYYGQGVNQAATGAGLYGQGVDQAMGRAGLYQNAAGMAGTAANLYGQGLGYSQQALTNRANALNFGYGALQDKNSMRRWANELASGAVTDYGNAQAQGSLAQGQIIGSAVGQGLNALGGFGVNQGWFGGGGSTGSFGAGANQAQQNYLSGKA